MVFLIWSICSLVFVAIALECFMSKEDKAVGFWANTEAPKVTNAKEYNIAVGKLWATYGIILEILGLPLLYDEDSPFIIFTVVGVIFITIIFMVIYTSVIEPKYKVK